MNDLSNAYVALSYFKTWMKICDEYSKQISEMTDLSKPLTMHMAWHTFTQISSKKVPANILYRLYQHPDISKTMAYQNNFINKTTDDQLETVIRNS